MSRISQLYDPRPCNDIQQIRKMFRWSMPRYFNIGAAICNRSSGEVNRPCLIYAKNEGDIEKYSYASVDKLSNRLGNALKSLAVLEGDRVGVTLHQSPQALITHLSILKIGALSVPISPLYGVDGLKDRLSDSGAKIWVTDAESSQIFRDAKSHVRGLKTIIVVEGSEANGDGLEGLVSGQSTKLEVVRTRADDPAFIIYTSGSTGRPKGVVLPHRTLLGRLPGLQLSHHPFPQRGDLFFSTADWSWVAGLLDSLFAPLFLGVPVLAYPRRGKFNPEETVSLMKTHTVRNACITPTALYMIMKYVQRSSGRHKLVLRSLHSGGEHLLPDIVHWARRSLRVTINEIYGMTEASFVIGNCWPLMRVKPGSMGKPYPGHRVEIVDERGGILPSMRVGRIVVERDDPVLFLGYWRDSESTRKAFVGDWFVSSDLAYKDEDGYFWFKGRADDVIRSSGHSISPIEVEAAIKKHPTVLDVAVTGVRDKIRGSVVKAFVKLSDNYAPSRRLARQLQVFVKTRLAAYAYPGFIEFVDEIPRTPTGKIARGLLNEMAGREQ